MKYWYAFTGTHIFGLFNCPTTASKYNSSTISIVVAQATSGFAGYDLLQQVTEAFASPIPR